MLLLRASFSFEVENTSYLYTLASKKNAFEWVAKCCIIKVKLFDQSYQSNHISILKYTSIEQVVKETVVVNKKDLKRFSPEEYSKCEIELTPKLTIQ